MQNRKRSGKFYSQNEKRTLKKLGLIPAPASGAGWVVKEDGENEILMVQLKSTDSLSYRVSRLDMKKLEFHANVSNKVPVFLVQFLKDDRIYAIVDVADIDNLFYGLKGIKPINTSVDISEIKNTIEQVNNSKEVISNSYIKPKGFVEKGKKEIYKERNGKSDTTKRTVKTSQESREKFFAEQEAARKKFKKRY